MADEILPERTYDLAAPGPLPPFPDSCYPPGAVALDVVDIELAEVRAATARRQQRRYKIAANTVEVTAAVAYVAMAVTAIVTDSGLLPAVCLFAVLGAIPVSWRLHRRAAEAQQRALEAQREASNG